MCRRCETRKIVGAEGVALSAGVGPDGGQVRVSAEQWQAVAAGRSDPGREPGPRDVPRRPRAHRRAALTDEHETAGQRAPAEEGGTTV